MRISTRAAVVAAVLVGTVVPAGTAQAAGARGAGYVWADQPTAASYTPSAGYQMNSTGPAVRNTIRRAGTGVYEVRFTALGVTGGIAHATAYGTGTNHCKVSGWHVSGSDQLVTVRCFTLAGAPADTRFTASYTNRTSWAGFDYGRTYPGAYVWADNPTAADYTPTRTYQYNSEGFANRVTRLGRGTYKVHLPEIGWEVRGGHAVATAYGSGSERCKVPGFGWDEGSRSEITVGVRCFTAAGEPVDTRFTLTFTDRTNILGLESCCNPNGHQSAHLLADDEDAASYTPAASYLHVTQGGAATGTRQGPGDYTMRLTNVNLGGGTVHVQSSSWDAEFCTVGHWSAGGIKVRCHDAAGAPVDTPYELSFTGPWLLG
ncbi:hypothetical protein [Actinokineospora fastidiosa]|uniref:Uncharacterized protein n=1 Tax=Actinokineospora fastidiosa TaxID=1816 RepID=A0A918GP31_9PSEU|nr:hypothetical protein [Actinokineospora fastidiosa]GGS51727.1 hypothetical protein GCM10010171_53480 [Actinokineospora fastidiosa]